MESAFPVETLLLVTQAIAAAGTSKTGFFFLFLAHPIFLI